MKQSFPDGFIEHLNQAPGFEEGAFIEAHKKDSELSLRIHPRKGNNLFQDHVKVSWCSEGRYLSERPDFTLDPRFHGGAYYVQEASSMCIQTILNELSPDSKELVVLDLCGAPGGKSTLVASWLDSEGLHLSNEVIRSRAGILKENMDRWGYPNVIVSNNDPRQFGKLEGIFDIVIIDAPCSGSGMFRKDPAAMEHWSQEAVEHCAARQKRIIGDVWPSLKKGAFLIYSTCSFSIEEDEEICNWLIEEENAELIEIKSFKQFPEIYKSSLGYRFYPDQVKGEGFFIAVIQKKTNEQQNLMRPAKLREIPSEIQPFIGITKGIKYHHNHLGNLLVPTFFEDYLSLIEKHLHIIKCGIKAGEIKGKNFIPDHELAMSVDLNKDFSAIELSKEEALRYLKKEAIPNNGGASGWVQLRFDGITLGWGNALSNRINNGLPKSWRIRKELE